MVKRRPGHLLAAVWVGSWGQEELLRPLDAIAEHTRLHAYMWTLLTLMGHTPIHPPTLCFHRPSSLFPLHPHTHGGTLQYQDVGMAAAVG